MTDGASEPVVVENPDGSGPFVILCDHASNRIPEDYASFGFDEDSLQTHIAWDPGALAVARLLSAELDAPLDLDALVAAAQSDAQKVELYTASRLAIDPDTRAERGYLDLLAGRLGLPDALVEHVEATVSAAKAPQPEPAANPKSPW